MTYRKLTFPVLLKTGGNERTVCFAAWKVRERRNERYASQCRGRQTPVAANDRVGHVVL
jgi:hypothetical protein